MIEPGKFLARIGSSGVAGASNGLFQRSDGRRLMMTLTDELFLPTRIVYCVKDREELVSRFHNLRCMMFDPFRTCWLWQWPFQSVRWSRWSAIVLRAFYEDGEEHMKGAMQMREIMAMAQYLSDTPIKPYQVIRELFQNAYANR